MFGKKNSTENRYETIFVTNPDLEDAKRKAMLKKMADTVKKKKGKVHVSEDCGKFKLAYEVKRNIKGNFMYLGYEGDLSVIKDVERSLRLDESVIKFITVKVDEFDPKIVPLSSKPDLGKRSGSGFRDSRYGGGRRDEYGESSHFDDEGDSTKNASDIEEGMVESTATE